MSAVGITSYRSGLGSQVRTSNCVDDVNLSQLFMLDMSDREVYTANLMREAEVRALHAHKAHLLSLGHREADINMWIEVGQLI